MVSEDTWFTSAFRKKAKDCLVNPKGLSEFGRSFCNHHNKDWIRLESLVDAKSRDAKSFDEEQDIHVLLGDYPTTAFS